jgi:NADH kinase
MLQKVALDRVLILKKLQDEVTTKAMSLVLKQLKNSAVYCEEHCFRELDKLDRRLVHLYQKSDIDLVITLGGDGTILHANRLFQGKAPPILSFSLGSLGFLAPYQISDAPSILKDISTAKAQILNRPRLTLKYQNLKITSLNEFVISAQNNLVHMRMDLNGSEFTTVGADGVIVSTSSGSTGYSLSCGGPIVHPNIECIIVNQICPQSLSFRPFLIPLDFQIKLYCPDKPVAITADGKFQTNFEAGYLEIAKSEFDLPCITDNGWKRDLDQLSFNKSVKRPK